MADQSTFSVVVENIVSPVHRLTVGWGDMGRTWVLSLPGSMTPDAVEAVVQTMRRVVGAAVEEERRETTARIGAEAEELKGKLARVTHEREKVKDELHHVRSACEGAHVRLEVQMQIAQGAVTQRDEQTARLKVALDELEQVRADFAAQLGALVDDGVRLHAEHTAVVAERDALAKEREAWLDEDTRWMARVVGLEVEVRKLTEERDALKASKPAIDAYELAREFHGYGCMVANGVFAREPWDKLDIPTRTVVLAGVRAVLDRLGAKPEPTASKPTVDMQALDNLVYNTYWATPGNTEVTLRAVVRAVVARLGLTPATPQTATDLVPLSRVTSILDTFAARLDGHAQSVRDDHDRADECAQADDIDRFEAGAKAVREAAELVRNELAAPAAPQTDEVGT